MITPFRDLAEPEPEVVAMLPSLIAEAEQALAGADFDAVDELVGSISIALPPVRATVREGVMRLELYARSLSDLPADALHEGMLAGLKVWRFFPTIAEIREQALPFVAERQRILSALRALAMKARA